MQLNNKINVIHYTYWERKYDLNNINAKQLTKVLHHPDDSDKSKQRNIAKCCGDADFHSCDWSKEHYLVHVSNAQTSKKFPPLYLITTQTSSISVGKSNINSAWAAYFEMPLFEVHSQI